MATARRENAHLPGAPLEIPDIDIEREHGYLRSKIKTAGARYPRPAVVLCSMALIRHESGASVNRDCFWPAERRKPTWPVDPRGLCISCPPTGVADTGGHTGLDPTQADPLGQGFGARASRPACRLWPPWSAAPDAPPRSAGSLSRDCVPRAPPDAGARAADPAGSRSRSRDQMPGRRRRR